MTRTFVAMCIALAATGCADREALFGPSVTPSTSSVARSSASVLARAPDVASTPPSANEPPPASPPATVPDPDALLERARAALAAHDIDGAEKLAREALAADSDSADAHVVLGDVALDRKHPSEALGSYERALALDANDGWALVRASEALAALGRRDEARERLRTFAASHANASADVCDALGWAELEAHAPAHAKAAFTRALAASDEHDADAWYGLAVLAADAGNARETERALRRVLALEPSRRAEAESDEAFEPVRSSPEWRALFASPQPTRR
jgi:tetratricopeptide (TPR) repeat protein